MANIITSKTKDKAERSRKCDEFKKFYGRHDQTARVPSFCHPISIERMREERRSLIRTLEEVPMDMLTRSKIKQELNLCETRLNELDEDNNTARKEFKDDADRWAGRRERLGNVISEVMPTRKQERDGRVNPYTVLLWEKGTDANHRIEDPDTKEKRSLEEMKIEYQVLSGLTGNEPDVSFLQKD